MGDNRIQTMFPEKDGIDYSLLQITPEGEYSMTRKTDGKRMLAKMISVIGNTQNKSIIDLTGNVGGDTILFGMNFDHVCSIELEKDNFKALKNNVEVFKLDNVNIINGDSTEIFFWRVNVVYIDPPWGGPEYKHKENLDLFLGTQRLDTYLKFLLNEPWRPDYIFLKLPRNYNFERLVNLPNITKEHKFNIRNFFLICLEVCA